MVTVICYNCKKNLGNRTCEKYKDYIPDEVISSCKDFTKITSEEFDEKLDKQIDVFEGFSDEDD